MPWKNRPVADRDGVSPYTWEHPSWKKWHKRVESRRDQLDITIKIKLVDGSEFTNFCKRTRNTINPPYNIVPIS